MINSILQSSLDTYFICVLADDPRLRLEIVQKKGDFNNWCGLIRKFGLNRAFAYINFKNDMKKSCMLPLSFM